MISSIPVHATQKVHKPDSVLTRHAMNINNYVFINRKVLEIVGLYPINVTRNVVCELCMFLIIIPQTLQIYQDWQDLSTVLETCSVLLTILLTLLKSFVWIINSKNIESFINFMLSDYWQIAISNGFFSHLEKYATYAKNITKGYLFLICNALIVFFSLPIVDILILMYKGVFNDATKHFPFVASYPTLLYKSPFYEVVYISQILATSICGIMVLATDTLIATALIHTCGHFATLQEHLKSLDSNFVLMNGGDEQVTKQYKIDMKYRLTCIIKHHQIILWFCDKMEKNFSPMLLLQTVSSTLIICLVGFQVSVSGLTDHTKLTKYFSYLLMALFQLSLFCFPGDELLNQSSMVSHVLYSTEWYQSSLSIKIDICMIMLRSQKPSVITAGKFYVMHLENFNAILSSSLSYFMLLRSFNS